MNRTEFDSWVWQVGPALHRTGFLLTGDWVRARELVVDACARTHARFSSLSAPESYARAVLARAATDDRRKTYRASAHSEHSGLAGLLDDRSSPPARDRATTLTSALEALAPRERTVLVLQYYDGLTEEQIADDLDCSVETVHASTDRALDALRAWGLDDGWEN